MPEPADFSLRTARTASQVFHESHPLQTGGFHWVADHVLSESAGEKMIAATLSHNIAAF
jgi:hypothetical protein